MRRMPAGLNLMLLVVLALTIGAVDTVNSAVNPCAACHQDKVNAWSASKHVSLACEACHEGAANHAMNQAVLPKVHFDMEFCQGCHQDQYNSYLYDLAQKTYYKGSLNPPTVWPKTLDFPFWNSIIDGHGFVIETYENRAMKFNQIDAQNTLRPMSESCLVCHGTKIAYYMGTNGVPGQSPGRTRTVQNTQIINSGNFQYWQRVSPITIPAGTKVSTTVDTVNSPVHEVQSLVTLPDGRLYASYSYPGAKCGNDPDPAVRTEARNYVWAALEALALDGLDPVVNKPSIDAGELCNMCHDPHSGKMRIIQKSLIWAISQRGINPYSPTGSQIKDFSQASHQDQVIAVCGQCHVEYVGGYSAVDYLDRHFFPWAKPQETETLYSQLFNYQQDWLHGIGVRPWQTTNPGKPGYYPQGSLYPIREKLIKSQHPEAEVFWNSRMYNGGATCTDCHAARITRPDGTQYTSHWFASPIKWIDNKGVVPCAKCHSMCGRPITGAQAKQKIKNIQDQFFFAQEKTQAALVNSLKYINSLSPGAQRDAALKNHQQAHFRWEYYAQAENSMGFHNWDEANAEMAGALQRVSTYVPWPLPPVRLKVTGATTSSIALSWYDQAANEAGFVVERQDGAASPFVEIARIPAQSSGGCRMGGGGCGTGTGTVTWTNTGLPSKKTYGYRVAAYNSAGMSTYTLVATGATN